MTTAAISIQELRKSFGLSFALGPLSLEIPRGAICALVGPNGAGKTTLMNLLMGVGRADAGSATVLGHHIVAAEVAVKRSTAFVSPDLSYRAWGTVGRAINFVSAFYPDWNAQRCEELQYLFGLHSGERIDSLSFGARTKLSVLMALSREPELLLLDEPTAGLDPIARQLLFTELLRFMANENRTILISSHQISDLERFADHVAILNAGRVVACGEIPDLLARYVQVDALVKSDQGVRRPGIQVLGRDGSRVRLLIDRTVFQPRELAALGLATLGLEVVSEISLTLEELFVALVEGAGARRWQPRMVAA